LAHPGVDVWAGGGEAAGRRGISEVPQEDGHLAGDEVRDVTAELVVVGSVVVAVVVAVGVPVGGVEEFGLADERVVPVVAYVAAHPVGGGAGVVEVGAGGIHGLHQPAVRRPFVVRHGSTVGGGTDSAGAKPTA
jgi:hypothetical protein